jgi:drug/metabolite transporter (DMT)-like permease
LPSGSHAGVILASVGTFSVTLNDALMKELIEGAPLMQIIFLRSAAASIVLGMGIPFVGDAKRLMPRSWNGTLLIALLQAPTLLLFPLSLYFLPLTTALILVYISPVFVVLLAPLFSGHDKPGPRRIAAVSFGFLGAVIVIGPTFDSIDVAMLIPIACALLAAMRDLATYRVSQSSHPLTITLVSLLAVMLVSGAFMLGEEEWAPLSTSTTLMLVGAAAFIGLGQLLLVMALKVAAAYLVATLKYSAIIWSVVLSYLIWAELPQWRELVGGAFIVASGIAIVRIRSNASTALPRIRPRLARMLSWMRKGT